SSVTYYGLHLGTGYIWNINEQASLDLYGKYFGAHQNGDSVKLSTNDPVRFEDVDSQRLRGGARFSYAVNESVSPYIGAAYEHEFDGRAKAATYGYAIEAPELTGGTGIGELGLNFKPSPTLPLSLDLGVQGYVGQREGVTGSLQIKFEF
ncbi:MAG: autotransporter outer membrane beta-barrel domain-containing protein, partial [Candidatus Adiutrix sp.]|nr:autotransporter outer membrane beta-barrel domain-containing protein [Candidatus Adiutrix sp.]